MVDDLGLPKARGVGRIAPVQTANTAGSGNPLLVKIHSLNFTGRVSFFAESRFETVRVS